MAVRRVLLLGQPNVGKSSLLRAITGAHVQVSNYPGTTVEVSMARTIINGNEYEFIDTPGIYNLYPSSIEEIVTERTVLKEDYDFAVVVVDATAIERGLVFLLSLVELGVPIIIALNFWEEAERKGVIIDTNGLSRELGVPIIKINPVRKGGVVDLVRRIGSASRSTYIITYDDHIEKAILASSKCLENYSGRLSRRGLAVRLVEKDPLVTSRFECQYSRKARETLIREGHDPYNDVEATRAGHALHLARKYVRLTAARVKGLNRVDEALLRNSLLGASAGIALLAFMILLTVILGDWIVSLLDSLLGGYVGSLVSSLEQRGVYALAAAKSIQALYAQYAAALPYVFIFYFILVILEDTGFLVRLMLWLYAFTKKMGIHPKGVIPALLGLGCSVPATTATRILPSTRQRLAVISMLAFIPCSSRATIVFGIAGRVAGALAALGIYALGFLLASIVAKTMSRALRAEQDAILIEDIPPLRRPNGSIVVQKAWQRLEDFILIVTPLIIAGAVAYAFLTYYNVDRIVVGLFAPFMRILHLPLKLSIPLVYGFLQKDLVISMTAAVLGTSNFHAVLSARQAIIFTMASTYQVPCIIALGMMIRELGIRKAAALWLILDIVGFTAAALFANIP